MIQFLAFACCVEFVCSFNTDNDNIDYVDYKRCSDKKDGFPKIVQRSRPRSSSSSFAVAEAGSFASSRTLAVCPGKPASWSHSCWARSCAAGSLSKHTKRCG